MSERAARSRELVAAGYRPAVVARIARISRQAIYRVPRRRPPSQQRAARPPADAVEQAIVETCRDDDHQSDGYRMITASCSRKLGVAVNRKRVRRVMRLHGLTQRRRPLERRKRPGFFCVERPDQLWHLDATSIWVAENGWCPLLAIIDCCTREIVGYHLGLRGRAVEAISVIEQAAAARGIEPGTLTLGTDNGSAFTARATRRGAPPARHQAPPRRLPRSRKPGVHRVLVRQTQGTGGLAQPVRNARRRHHRRARLHRPLPPAAALGPGLPDATRGRRHLETRTRTPINTGLNRQPRRGAGHPTGKPARTPRPWTLLPRARPRALARVPRASRFPQASTHSRSPSISTSTWTLVR